MLPTDYVHMNLFKQCRATSISRDESGDKFRPVSVRDNTVPTCGFG